MAAYTTIDKHLTHSSTRPVKPLRMFFFDNDPDRGFEQHTHDMFLLLNPDVQ